MEHSRSPYANDVDHLLRNAELRDELEPYMDESIACLEHAPWSIEQENEYLASMLGWECAPAVPIGQWFEPHLEMPDPRGLSEDEVQELLWDVIHRLYEKRIVIVRTDHLSDLELFLLLKRDILPAREKLMEPRGHFLCWDCVDSVGDPDTWLRFYATDEERSQWSAAQDAFPPRRMVLLYPRLMPGRDLV